MMAQLQQNEMYHFYVHIAWNLLYKTTNEPQSPRRKPNKGIGFSQFPTAH